MSFSEDKARQKLNQLDNTQQSIQTTSQWCLFHYRHSNDIVALWVAMFLTPDPALEQSEPNYRLAMFYLCNDLVQFAKKKEAKYKTYLDDFREIMPQIIENVAHDSANAHLTQKYSRVLDVWRERSIFPPGFIAELQTLLNGSSAKGVGPDASAGAASITPAAASAVTTAAAASNTRKAINDQGHDRDRERVLPRGPADRPQNPDAHIPEELVPTVHKYRQLDGLHRSYKASYIEFNKLASKLLSEDGENQAQKTTQLNNLLSSLSSLQNSGNGSGAGGAAGEKNPNGVHDSTNLELKRLEDAEQLGVSIESQSQAIATLRTGLAAELRRLASELDDWVMLDRSKQQQIKKLVGDVKAKKDELVAERENVSVYHYGDDDDDNGESVPAYADDDDDDADSGSDRKRADSDSDSDDDDDENEDAGEANDDAVPGAKRTLDEHSDDSESGQDDDALRKRKKKSVSFANDTETRVFDKDDTIKPSESPEPAPANASADQDLETLLGMLN